MSSRDAVFDLSRLRESTVMARERISQWPTWKQEVVAAVHGAAFHPPRFATRPIRLLPLTGRCPICGTNTGPDAANTRGIAAKTTPACP